MKNLFAILATVILTASVFLPRQASAQSPQKMGYQAVIRDATNNLITSHVVGMQVSILQGSGTGTEVYKEIYNPNPQTNANGLVTVEIGGGIPITGTFASINWSNGTYFIKTETDPAGGTNFTITGISQILSVPYAYYAQKAGNGFSGNYNDLINKPNLSDSSKYLKIETDPVFNASIAKGIKSSDTVNWNAKIGYSELQKIYKNITTLNYLGF